MIDFANLKARVSALKLNLYDLSIQTDAGIETCRFQPCNACNNSYSVAKAFIMSAVGLLADAGKLRVTDSLVGLMGPLAPANLAPEWHEVTVAHALTHRIGFERGFLDIDVEDPREWPTDDYLSLIFAHPLACAPGERYVYSDAAYYLLSRLVEQVSGEPTERLLQRSLLGPMAFRESAWSLCPQHHIMGATGLYCSSADMVKLGWLYLHGGRYEGKQLLSQAWTQQAIEQGYELRPLKNTSLIGKCGMWGQAVAFDRESGAAVAWHAYEEPRRMEALMECIGALLRP